MVNYSLDDYEVPTFTVVIVSMVEQEQLQEYVNHL